MDPDLPYWLVITASALGGAGLTGLVTAATKVVDLRHRHDDTKRDHYVALLDALDAWHRATVPAAIAASHGLVPEPDGGFDAEDEVHFKLLRDNASEMAQAVEPFFTEARLAFQRVSLFAPFDVLDAAQAFYKALERDYMQLFANVIRPPVEIFMPTWPEDAWRRYQNTVRGDLGFKVSRRVDRSGHRSRREPLTGAS
ncbi:hypothetical protein ASG36_14675 [Geodermatophilus sp. Leaf369]|uniref:hypothetical protein n=1 Tax=Geodermatophilus sp. Leaf369 TaxID=1736354 RepID=UPI0006F6F9D8|nr:hypothetical protein [Geodermatophilus sp. Leaf369]KQS57833.1 hypothetical protein ASG36_14675 [Geodermatophilus sp. Leaf369]